MNQEFLEPQDNDILNDTLREFGVDEFSGYVRFWNRSSVQLDGDFSLKEMLAISAAMKIMEITATIKELNHVQNLPSQ